MNRIPNAWNTPKEASEAQDWISTTCLTPYSTVAVRKSWTDFWTLYVPLSTPTATHSHGVDPITSNMRFLYWLPSAVTKTWHLNRRRWQTIRNGRAPYLWTLSHATRTLTSVHTSWPRFMGTRINIECQWLHWSRNKYNLHKNRSAPMRIVWKLIGDRLGGIYRSMKTSSMTLPGQASTTLSRTKLNHWYPAAWELTHFTRSSIRPRPSKLHMLKSLRHSSSNPSTSNSSRNSLRTRLPKAATEVTGHPSLSQRTPQPANPANRDPTNTVNPAAVQNRQS